MFCARQVPVLLGILALSCMFLLGQETWPPECVDNDGDGYGNPASVACTHPERDCDDANPDVNPGATEGPIGDPVCSDLLDNDCDYSVDMDDGDCTGSECFDLDQDGYFCDQCIGGFDCNDDPSDDPPVCDTCSCGEVECAPCAYCQHPGATEFPGDGVDSNCNGQDN